MARLEERAESLWWLVVAPTIWAAHLLGSYATVAVWCAKVAPDGGELGPARTAVVVYTVVALLGVAAAGRRSWRRYRWGGGALPLDDDTPGDRHRFIGFAGFLLAALSLVAIAFGALPVLFIWSCR
jgi:hypothetical protein